jgi:hypothetical protein
MFEGPFLKPQIIVKGEELCVLGKYVSETCAFSYYAECCLKLSVHVIHPTVTEEELGGRHQI